MLRAMVGKVRITVIYETSGTEMLQRRSSAGEHRRRKPSLLLCIRNNRKLPMIARSLKCNRVCSGTHANSCIPLLLSPKESLLRNKRKWPKFVLRSFIHTENTIINDSSLGLSHVVGLTDQHYSMPANSTLCNAPQNPFLNPTRDFQRTSVCASNRREHSSISNLK
jgi:hypothetical protein